jgi:hypothetical protein
MAKAEAGGGGSLRDWAEPSYSVKTGRAVSSNGGRAPGSGDASTQIREANAGGRNGAPGVSALDKSGSADRGRRKWGGSELP